MHATDPRPLFGNRCPVDPTSAPAGRPRRVGLVGTFPPRPCGLATFTADVATSLREAGDEVVVVALVDDIGEAIPDVWYQFVQDSAASARDVGSRLSTDVDIVLVEHEFGIFGGRDSSVLEAFTESLTVPYVVTLHTVLERFEPWMIRSLATPLAGASLVFVFSDEAIDLLDAQFPGVAARCCIVPHPAPTALFRTDAADAKEALGLRPDTFVVSTFGLLSPSKGIEHAIGAMPHVRDTVGDVVYLVAGRTHPEVVRLHGERYRSDLEALTRSLDAEDVVQFRDWFHDVDELSTLLHASDVFVTPYSDAEQIVSGALSFAIAAGVPFVSTPYRYATGLAAQGCGLTVPFADPAALSDALCRVLEDHDLRRSMARRAERVSSTRSWPQIGHQIHGLLDRALDARWTQRPGRRAGSVRSVHVRVA